MTTSLTIDARTYEPADLLAWEGGDHALSENAAAALDFCRRWLGGEQEFVVRTSGSTGTPRPITLQRAQMKASAQATATALDLRAGTTALICLPVRFIAGQMMLVRGLELGMAMTLVEPAADPLASLPAGVTYQFMAVVPLQLQTLLDGPNSYRKRLDRMKAVLVGGAPVSPALEQRVRTVTAPVFLTYGMTETATHIALRRLNGPDASAWFDPLPGVEIATDDRNCLRVKGPMTLDRWLQTNDLVELPATSGQPPQAISSRDDVSRCARHAPRFRWLGRWDNVINSGGVKVQVEVVEAAAGQAWLALALAERRFFVAGLPDQRLGEMVALVIEGEPLPRAQESALHAAMARALPAYEVPRQVIYAPCFVETATGKIDRRASLAAA